MGILQARILEWVAMPFSRGSSQPRDWTQVSHMAGGSFTIWATREAPGRCTTHPYTVCLLTTSKYGPHLKHHEERDSKTNGGRKGEKQGKGKEKAERQREREYKWTGQNVNKLVTLPQRVEEIWLHYSSTSSAYLKVLEIKIGRGRILEQSLWNIHVLSSFQSGVCVCPHQWIGHQFN